MDDTQKISQTMTNTTPPQQQQGDQSPPQGQTIPQQPISAPSRESGPGSSLSSETLASLSTPEMVISPELHKETGAEVVHESPQLTPEDAKAGIVHSPASTPVVTATTQTITLPMTQPQAKQTVKMHRKVKDSLFWFAMLILRQWQIAQKHSRKGAS